jgi:CheY-like chemotaxis protein
LERLLREAGFQVRLTGNGEQGVEAFREWRPQFVWMDLRMPVMDGLEAARLIRDLEGGRDVKIAAVTASGYDSKRSDVLAAGFDDYLRKPYRPDEIFESMERHLGVRYRRAEAEPPLRGRPAGELRPEAIAALPASLCAELRDAVVALDGERISRTIQKVSEHDAALGAALSRHAKGYAYTPILLAVEGGKAESSSNGA